MADDIHRLGGASVANLRLRPNEAKLRQPGLSVLCAETPAEAAEEMRRAYPKAEGLKEASKAVASTSAEKILAAGFEVIAYPSARLPSHYRIIHPDGVAGFTDENLALLAAAFTETEME